MKTRRAVCCLLATLSLAGVSVPAIASPDKDLKKVKQVILLSIDGMHALDFANCATGLPTVNNGAPYCPNMASIGQHAVNYISASTSKPSDSFNPNTPADEIAAINKAKAGDDDHPGYSDRQLPTRLKT